MKSTFSKIALAVFFSGLLLSCKPEINPSASVESVTLDKQTLELVVGQRDSLVATVLPENASDKSVVWTSSADSVVTVTDGKLEALSLGNATIKVTTVQGEKTAECLVTVLSAPQPGSLDGMFSVAVGKKIRFSKGNLRYSLSNSTWSFYPEQYNCGPVIYTDGHNSEISLFTWGYGEWSFSPDTKSHSTAYAEAGASLANSDDWGAALAETGSWRTLTSEEWNYILIERDGAADKCKYGVSVCGHANCLVIAPDNFTGTLEGSYTQETWAAAEQNDKLVCLPAAGLRNGDVTVSVGESGHYWTASSAGEDKAVSIDTQAAPVKTAEANKLAPRFGHLNLAPVSSNTGSADESVTIDMGRKPVASLNQKLKLTGNLKRGTKSATVSNSKQQQSVQKELVVRKASNEKKFQKVKNFSGKRSGVNAHNSRTSAKFTSSPRTAGSTNITIGTFSPTTYPGEYYVTLTDANSTTQFFFDFDTSVNPFELGKTYTLDDMIADYVAVSDKDDWYVWDPATAATYTETKDEKGLTHIVASMTAESGATYNLTYDQPEPQNIDVTAVDWYYDGEYYDVYVYSETTTYLFELKEDLVYGKAYTYADMVSDWTCTLTSAGYRDITATDATLTVTKDEAGLMHIAAMMVLSGDKHIIAYDEKPFEPSGVQINVNGTDLNGRYMSYYGFYLYTATWGDYTVQLAFDATEEKAAYTNDEFIADYGLIYSDDETIQLFKLASETITITNTETTKTLAGSIYAKNGDEYILNLVYEKPDAKEININVKDATLTNKSTIGFWKIDGQTEDKVNSFSIYFISKALQGTFTDVAQFDAYSTWVSDKSTGSNVYYENLSAVNLTSAVVGDSLKITGTMNLADDKGNSAIVTVYITTPFTQTWGDWADFAPFDVNTGKYAFTAALETTQTNMPVQVRKDNTGLKQYKFIGWGKQIFTANGIDLLVDLAPDNSCTIAEQSTGAYQTSYSEYLMISDMNTYTGSTNYPSTYDPETGVFELAVIYYISLGNFGYGYETMTMDKPITQRDTVTVKTDMKIIEEPAKGIIKVSGETEETTYILEVVGNNPVGTFSLADGTLSQKYYYGIVAKDGSARSDFAEGEVTIAETETGLKLDGLMIGVDEKAYVLDWTYTPITQRDTVKVNLRSIMVEEDVNSTTGAHRGWLYEGQDTDTLYIVQVLGNEQLGTFSYAAGTLGNNYYNIIPSSGQGRCQFTEGEVTIVEDEKGVKLNGLFIGEDEKAYVLNWIQPAGILQYDTDAPFDATFAYSDMAAAVEEGVIGIYATNAENLTIGLELYTDPANTTIPAGTYTISDTKEAGTALKSAGVSGVYLTECWAGVRASGGIADCWFLTEGKVILSYDQYGKLNVEVDAKNSWGQPVTAKVKYDHVAVDPLLRENGYSVRLVSDVE